MKLPFNEWGNKNGGGESREIRVKREREGGREARLTPDLPMDNEATSRRSIAESPKQRLFLGLVNSPPASGGDHLT